MNERIKELAEQAHHITADELAHLQRVHNRTYDLNESAAIYNEKFAELIVQECVKIAYQNDIAKFTRDGYQIGMDIQKHFGVEE